MPSFPPSFPPPSRPVPTNPGSQSPSAAELARAEDQRKKADARLALSRFETLSSARDTARRHHGVVDLGARVTPAPGNWAEDGSWELVAVAERAQPVLPNAAEEERRRLLWTAIAKIVGAVLAVIVSVCIAGAMAAGMAG